jgi:hypothetical protein
VHDTGYDWYVDSVTGDDANTGKSKSQAFQTLAAVSAVIAAGDKIGLARGSHWREQLTVSVNNVSLVAYGNGDRPIIDGSELMTGWSKTSGRTYVYQITCTPLWATSNDLNVWEDGTFLVRAASVASCDSTPGSYYPSAATGTITLYVHATGDGDPASNGKTYEYSHRQRSIFAANNGITGLLINGIHTRCNLEENGSILIYKYSTVLNCLIADGSRHNLYIGEGSYLAGTTLRDAYYGAGTYTLLVCYSPTGTGLGFVCENCTCENTRGSVDTLGTGFYGHSTSGSMGAFRYKNITASYLNLAVDISTSTGDSVIETLDASTCYYAINTAVNLTASGVTHTIQTNKRSIQLNAAGISLTLTSSTFTLAGTYPSSGHIYSANINLTINVQNCTFIDINTQSIIYVSGTGCSVYSRNNVFQAVTRPYNIAATGAVDSDYNRFTDDVAPILNGTTYNTLALWQAGTGNDQHSTLG